ncbi:MAG: hypothetical protein ABIE74_04935 [Pseudomonadota bacterium]
MSEETKNKQNNFASALKVISDLKAKLPTPDFNKLLLKLSKISFLKPLTDKLLKSPKEKGTESSGEKRSFDLKTIRQYADRFESIDWNKKILIILIGAISILYLLGPVHLLFRDITQLEAESLDRGKTLVRLLAASNQEAFGQDQEVLFSVDSAKGEVGVEEIFVTDNEGMILSPVELFGQQIQSRPRMDKVFSASADKLKAFDIGGGEYYLTYPIFNSEETFKGITEIRKGLAIIKYDARGSLNRAGFQVVEVIKLFIISVLMVWGLYYLLRRWTIFPLSYALHSFDESGKLNLSGKMKFAEFELLVDKINASKPILPDSPQSNQTDLRKVNDGFWEMLKELNMGDFLIVDTQKRVVATSGNINGKLGARVESGRHLLEGLGDSPFMKDILDLIVVMENKAEPREVNLKDGTKLRAQTLKLNSHPYYMVTAS